MIMTIFPRVQIQFIRTIVGIKDNDINKTKRTSSQKLTNYLYFELTAFLKTIILFINHK